MSGKRKFSLGFSQEEIKSREESLIKHIKKHRRILKRLKERPFDPDNMARIDKSQSFINNDIVKLQMLNAERQKTAHSSRFIYLQYAADGIIKKDGTLGRLNSTKFNKVMERIDCIVEKKQSALVYFSFYASLQTFEYRLRRQHPNIRILKSTGKDTFDPN